MSDSTVSGATLWGSLPARIRPEHLESLNEMLDFAFGGLRKASEIFEAPDGSKREGMVQAVETAMQFFCFFDCVQHEKLQSPLTNLLSDLLQLDEGEVRPALTPQRRSGRHRSSAISDAIKGAAVFTSDRLCRIGLSLDDADRLVAATLSDAGVTAQRGRFRNLAARTIRTWREAASADVQRRGEAAQTCEQLEQTIPLPFTQGLNETDLRQLRENYLVMLADAVRKING